MRGGPVFSGQSGRSTCRCRRRKAAPDVARKRVDALHTSFEAWRDLTWGPTFPRLDEPICLSRHTQLDKSMHASG
ncbi:hypothetical protein EMIT0111MI5_40357 [Burkholderia sp. IT-111MI5]